MKRPDHEEVREALDVLQALLEFGQYFEHAFSIVFRAAAFGYLRSFGVGTANKSDWLHLEHTNPRSSIQSSEQAPVGLPREAHFGSGNSVVFDVGRQMFVMWKGRRKRFIIRMWEVVVPIESLVFLIDFVAIRRNQSCLEIKLLS